MMKKHLFLSLIAGVALSGVLRADDAASSASASTATASAAADTSTAATAAATPVAANDAPGSLKAGKDLLNAGKYAEAAAYFEGIGEQVADHGKAKREPYRLLDLTTAYLDLGQFDKAVDTANQALALKKDFEPAWNDLASAQANLGQRDKAIDTYTKGIAELTADKEDASPLQTNLTALQAEVDKTNARKHKKSAASATAAAPAAVSPAAASATSATAGK